MHLQAVLFDFNGVLVDDEHLHFEGFNTVLAPHEIVITPDEYRDAWLGFDDRGVFEGVLALHRRAVTPDLVASLIRAKSACYAARAATSLVIFDGAPALLRAVARHVPVLIVSGALRDEITGALDVMGARDTVAHIVAAEDVTACKPDPDGYQKAVAWLRERDPSVVASRCVALEDSTAGVASARAAGVRALAVAHTYEVATLRAAGASRVFSRLADVRFEDLEDAAGVLSARDTLPPTPRRVIRSPQSSTVTATDPFADVMAEFQAEFLATMPERLGELRAALARCPDDLDARDTVRRVGHRLAGTAATVGLDPIGKVGRAVENLTLRCAWSALDLVHLHGALELLGSLAGPGVGAHALIDQDPRYLALLPVGGSR
jgi:beta-phosphoglucomutase-like phosphatase (HAD superfamily)/HPt (histidine-containing phosphotransfer) domain-containing protein